MIEILKKVTCVVIQDVPHNLETALSVVAIILQPTQFGHDTLCHLVPEGTLPSTVSRGGGRVVCDICLYGLQNPVADRTVHQGQGMIDPL